jgi:WD40 repeat protein
MMKHFNWIWLTFIFLQFYIQSYAQQSSVASIQSIAYSPDGRYIAYGSAYPQCLSELPPHEIQILDVQSSTLIQSFPDNLCGSSGLSWNRLGNKLATSSYDMVGLSIWDIETGEVLKGNRGAQGTLTAKWNPVSNIIAVTEISYEIILYDSINGNSLKSLPTTGTSLDWNSNGTKLLVGIAYQPGGVYIIDPLLDTDVLDQDFIGHTDRVRGVDWSPDDQKIASVSADNTLRIWDADNGQQLNLFNIVDPITIKFSPDSRYVAVGTGEGLVLIFDTVTNTQVAQFTNPGAVYALDWSPDGTQLAYGGTGNNGEIVIVTPDFSAVPTLTPTFTPLPPTETPYYTPTPVACDVNIPSGDTLALSTEIINANTSGIPTTICLDGGLYTVTGYYQEFFGKTAFAPITGDITIAGYGATHQHH